MWVLGYILYSFFPRSRSIGRSVHLSSLSSSNAGGKASEPAEWSKTRRHFLHSSLLNVVRHLRMSGSVCKNSRVFAQTLGQKVSKRQVRIYYFLTRSEAISQPPDHSIPSRHALDSKLIPHTPSPPYHPHRSGDHAYRTSSVIVRWPHQRGVGNKPQLSQVESKLLRNHAWNELARLSQIHYSMEAWIFCHRSLVPPEGNDRAAIVGGSCQVDHQAQARDAHDGPPPLHRIKRGRRGKGKGKGGVKKRLRCLRALEREKDEEQEEKKGF